MFVQPFAAVASVFGAVRSMLTFALSALVELPALSLTDAVAYRPMPSPEIVPLAGVPTTPERSSVAVQPTATSALYQPSRLALLVGAPLSVGLVLSMLMPLTPPVVLFPALSTASPGTD